MRAVGRLKKRIEKISWVNKEEDEKIIANGSRRKRKKKRSRWVVKEGQEE